MKPNIRDESRPALAAALILAVAFILALALAAGAKGDDDSPILQIMEQLQTRSRAIGKGLRSSTALETSGRTALTADAKSLARLGKQARELTEPARERNKPRQDWTRAADKLIRAADDLATIVGDPETSRPDLTQAFQKLQKTCTGCHSAFRDGAD